MRKPERRKRLPKKPVTQKKSYAKTSKKKPVVVPKKSTLSLSILRGLIFLVLFVAGVSVVATFLLKGQIQTALSRKITDSSSMVFSRALPISRGIKLDSLNLKNRLQRLKYREVPEPSTSGEYRYSNTQIRLFLRESQIPSDFRQDKRLYDIIINQEGIITDIKDTHFGSSTERIWLEPEVISVLGDSSQRVVVNKTLGEFSPYLKNAILAIEDEHFYLHFGIDPFSILRATLVNLKSGRVVQGGSTLTQQLAKNLFFSPDRTIFRKIKEASAAILIESTYSKDQIFEMYLNEVFLGQEGRFAIHGFGEASRTFYGKEVSRITLAESALLAGLVKAPTSYSPRLNFKRATERKNVVLARMHELKMISEEEYRKAQNEKIKIYPPVRSRRVAPYFVDYIQREVQSLIDKQGLEGGALKIISGLDYEYQSCAEKAVEDGISSLEKNYSWIGKSKEKVQSALVSVIPSNGEIRAWVGGRDFSESQFDRISSAKRQPGSTFKPFVYLTALDGNLNQYRMAKTTSILLDEPLKIKIPGGVWEPKNYDKEYRGEVRLREALARSLNIPTVQLAEKVGIKNIARVGAYFGFGENLPQVPSLALGAGEVSPLELTYAYSILANGGLKRTFRPFFSIIDSNTDNLLYTNPVLERRVVDEGPVYILTDILRSAVESGTGRIVRQLGVKGAVAGKTGTTNDARDSWFVGYTPRILTTVWVGFDSNKELRLTGAQAAAPIWASYMKCIKSFEPELDFFPPETVISTTLDKYSGLLLTEHCPLENAVTELFIKGTEPITPCPLHSSSGKKDIDEILMGTE